MKSISLTKSQAQELVAYHNSLVKDEYAITEDQAYLLFTDEADNEMRDQGECQYEISKFQTLSGNPEIIWISQNEVTFA